MGHLTFVHTKCVVVLWHFAATCVSKSGHSCVNKPSVSMSHLSCHVLGRPVWSIWIFEQTIDEFWCSYPMYFKKEFAVSRVVTSSLCCYGMLAWSLVFMQYVPGWHLLTDSCCLKYRLKNWLPLSQAGFSVFRKSRIGRTCVMYSSASVCLYWDTVWIEFWINFIC